MPAHCWLADTHFHNISISSAPKTQTQTLHVSVKMTLLSAKVTIIKKSSRLQHCWCLSHPYNCEGPCTCERISLLQVNNATEKKRRAGVSYLFWDTGICWLSWDYHEMNTWLTETHFSLVSMFNHTYNSDTSVRANDVSPAGLYWLFLRWAIVS